MAGRFVLKLICFGLVSSGIAFGLQEILVFGLNRCNTSARGVWNKVIHGEVNAEILVCGSSRALIHYDPRIISREIGKSAFNTGRTGTFPDLQLSWLKTYLVHNRAPHYILLNVDRNCFCTTKHPYEPEQYIPYLDEPDLYRELVSRERRFARERRIPLLGIIEHRLVLTALGGLVRLNTREDRFDGFEPKDIPWTGEFEKFKALHPTGELASVENDGVKAFRKLIERGLECKASVVLVYSPEYCEAQPLTRNRRDIIEQVRKIAAEYGIEFWDFSDDPICLDKSLFYNSQHLNRQGASLFSSKLGERLKGFCSNGALANTRVADGKSKETCGRR